MRRRLPRILTVFAAAFGLGVWLGSMAHALSATPDSSCNTAACCRPFKRTLRTAEIHDALATAPCLLCQLGAAPATTSAAVIPTAGPEFTQPVPVLFAVKSAPALLCYAPRGRAPPTAA